MYKQHFGLSSELFDDGIASGSSVFCGPRQKVLAANLTIALTRRDSVAVVYGLPGVGKTTTVTHALREMTTRLALGTIAQPPLTAHELLEQLLGEFGFSPYKNSRSERLQMWRQFLSEMEVTETRVCILVENAQELNVEVLKALGSLTAADANGCPGANVILTATRAPDDLLNSPELAALRQRMRLQSTLAPLTPDETREYLAHRVEEAGGTYEAIFAPDAIEAVHAFSGGLIRVIDNVVESALGIAAARREKMLTAALVTRVAVGLFGIPAAQVAAGAKDAAPSPADTAQAEPKTDGALGDEPAGADTTMTHPVEESAEPPPSAAANAAPAVAPKPSVETAMAPPKPEEPVQSATEPAPALAVDDDGPSDAIEGPASLAQEDSVEPLADSIRAPMVETAVETDAEAGAEAPDAALVELESDVAPSDELEMPVEVEAADVPTLTDSVVLEPETDADEPLDATGITSIDGLDFLDLDTSGLEAALAAEDEIPQLDAITDGTEFDLAVAVTAGRHDERAATTSDTTEEQDVDQTQIEMIEAFANARDLEDISNSMAETLFGDEELEQLAATLSIRAAELGSDKQGADGEDTETPELGTRANR